MNLKKKNFLINLSKLDLDFFNKINFNKMINLITEFFEVKDFNVKVKLCNSLDEFKFFFPYEFKNWICGFFDNNGIIYVFSPKIIEKVTNHKKEEIPGIIFHELTHIIYKKLGLYRVNLLYEGIAVYLTNEYNSNNKNIQDIDLNEINIKTYPFLSKEVYNDGLRVINKIINQNGKQKLINLLKTIKNESEAKDIFKKIK